MKYTLLLLLIFISSCLHKGGELLYERGKVIGKQYSPDTRNVATGFGVSSSGSSVVTFHSIGEDEKYIIVFSCEHKKIFAINSPDLYAKLSDQDSVIIKYYELINKKGIVKDYEFIDANKISK